MIAKADRMREFSGSLMRALDCLRALGVEGAAVTVTLPGVEAFCRVAAAAHEAYPTNGLASEPTDKEMIYGMCISGGVRVVLPEHVIIMLVDRRYRDAQVRAPGTYVEDVKHSGLVRGRVRECVYDTAKLPFV